MIRAMRAPLAAITLALGAAGADAQVVDTIFTQEIDRADWMSCPEPPVLTAADLKPSAPAAPPRATDTLYYIPPPPPRPSIDTTIVLAVDRRDWSRDSYRGGVAISTDDLRRSARYTACAGASVELGRATVALRGVRGIVRLRADFRALEGVAGRGKGILYRSERPRTTRPAVPPRR